jgi:soluble lytic murein transglycosylase-like protein
MKVQHATTLSLEQLDGLPVRLLRWERQLHAAQLCYGVGPFLLAAIMDRESLGGEALTPKGPKGTGDHGHGRGLMQIDDRWHKTFLAAKADDGTYLWQDPTFNVMYAAQLMRRNLDALKLNPYAAVAAYNCGLERVRGVMSTLTADIPRERLIKELDAFTHGHNYVKDVFHRMTTFTTAEDTPNA